MGKPTGFKEFAREGLSYAPVADRIVHYKEFSSLPEDMSRQGARCMDCGIPFCHNGCPINNLIPDFNDAVYRGKWREALDILHTTNNFPEFTGRVCPAPCEEACTVNLIGDAVSIKNIELSIIEKGWEKDWIVPEIAEHKSGKRVAVVGSGPAGLSCAQQLARAGHDVVVFEKNDRIGGLMRYGIPNFKFDKKVIDRRLTQMRAEGVEFKVNANIGVDIPAKKLLEDFDAVVLTGGSEKSRDLPAPGRELKGIHFAMEFLPMNTKRVLGDKIPADQWISAEGKHVVVIGGGDTGSDCIGTSNRHGAASVTQIEILPKPSANPDKLLVWPNWPMKLRTSTSQEEGCDRDWEVNTRRFVDDGKGNVKAIECVRVEWKQENGQWKMSEVEDSEFELKADLVLLAMGFLHPVHEGMLDELGVDKDGRGNVAANTDDYRTSLDKVFSAGDMRRGQSLVVWAINEGRRCAASVDEYLMGHTTLPR
ncbi:MAG: glutamate synthase [Zetaproteobacteria bacterium CG12_big_fil_rev_8_21_14_0_65_55_1124]|nr:MAG: glutamate synthase [Zetaproteobacteria bacterium CG1_02_55_237]PIS18907.1 MAG: glutamate synthase [Zetaproteobacteria bacterium CG08_land_8_20_14_0_20_55_17]PIW41844.1 MAG: glutamate synthase [Zetaproteobacteria bacterium CG12_big_fil_rev_8_21_14_0_65_55_1124]PIY53473.1 MAG: glutamate synthase [Zetaproteobacteria bacterium CG_4_10_14_0_8_um_filter_55_43]PIZ39475.1 MAG: glutamate synthase [Zetaproteobacteria bacterium CG_4_10_14_0_2_um_filter_55_20]PJB81683.1 MAG: glutamate synthase [Ze